MLVGGDQAVAKIKSSHVIHSFINYSYYTIAELNVNGFFFFTIDQMESPDMETNP
jgi:hypothetical protein